MNELGRWQPIETAPKDGSSILGYSYIRGYDDIKKALLPDFSRGFYSVIKWYKGRWCNICDPIHPPYFWMPLPQAPDQSIELLKESAQAKWDEVMNINVKKQGF